MHKVRGENLFHVIFKRAKFEKMEPLGDSSQPK